MAQAITDVAIVGGGIVGLATAERLLREQPQLRVTLFEKERELAQHQTGHNSGVIHSGIYYKPGSLRATNCREGKLALQQFCREEGIPFELCGKVIVAVEQRELPQLEMIYQRGQANGVNCSWLEAEALREREPHVAGIKAIAVPEAGIVDYRQVAEKLAERILRAGGVINTCARVSGIFRRQGRAVVESEVGDCEARLVVNCAGLQSDRVTRLTGQAPAAKIVPFRGEYFELKPSAQHLCRHLVYPVPDPSFPFLGVHFTRMIHGGVECGPNAVLAFAREGYFKTSFHPIDFLESITYSGFVRLAWRHWRAGWAEFYRSWSKAAFVAALQRLIPEIQAEQLVPAPAGVRAQALLPDGQLVDDFLIVENDIAVNVCNAPSPAATASLNIGRLVTERVLTRFELLPGAAVSPAGGA